VVKHQRQLKKMLRDRLQTNKANLGYSAIFTIFIFIVFAVAKSTNATVPPAIISVSNDNAINALWNGVAVTLSEGGQIGPWTLMGIVKSSNTILVVFEDFGKENGRMVFVNKNGVAAGLPKSLEPTFALDPSKLYRGHSLKNVFDASNDLLGEEMLAKPGDPEYYEVAECFPPLLRGTATSTFLGTRENSDKVGFGYGGRTAHFDPAVYVPAIRKICENGKVWHGLVGGWLPILRFVYPEEETTWTEMLAFAPPRRENGNSWIQPGWCEADSCLKTEPDRYMQPSFSNAAEIARGFRELGEAWQIVGNRNKNQSLIDRGNQKVAESAALRKDLSAAIERSTFRDLQPQFRSYRAFMVMLHSSVLTNKQVKTIVAYRAAHHDTILGVPIAYGYNSRELAGFLTYGHAYGLLQHDMVREYLLTLYGMMAHQYARGFWTAPETRRLNPKDTAASYCTPAQLVVPMMLRSVLVMEDPATNDLWLAKGTPRAWPMDGQRITVEDAPTRWGQIGYAIRSLLGQNNVEADLSLSAASFAVLVILRLRTPNGYVMKNVRVDGRDWKVFNKQEETITLLAGMAGNIRIEASYENNSN
jgi:hypothetical protein